MKINAILASFTKADWHWFQKFLQSPIYNKHVFVLRLFNVFRAKPALIENQQSSDFLYKKVYPNEPINPAKIHHATSYLLQNLEDYLAWDAWWQDEPERQRYLLQACRQRGIERLFVETLQKSARTIDQNPIRNAAHYRFCYTLALEQYQRSAQVGGRSTPEQLQSLLDWHDVSFVAEKLKYACGIYSHRRLMQTELDMGLLPSILAYVRERPGLLDHPAVAVYYYGYLALSEPQEDAHFFALKSLLGAAKTQFPLTELRDVYMLAVNFCIHRINLRQESYLREVFFLYKNGLEAKVFFENGQMSRYTYTNIALTAFRLQEFEWAHRFLHDYRDWLPEAQRQGTFAFNLARYHCEQGEYDLAMPMLLTMDFDDVLHNLIAKAMLAKMYWETREQDALDSLLASLAAYLRRKRQVTEQQRIAYQNFVRFMRRLQGLPPKDSPARMALREEINQTALLAEKDWLLRML